MSENRSTDGDQRSTMSVEHVVIPVLKPREFRAMIIASGYTFAGFSIWLQKSRSYVHDQIARNRITPKLVEALYLYIGRDMFCTVYEQVTKKRLEVRDGK